MLRPSRKRDSDVVDHPTRLRLVEEAARQIKAAGIEGVDIETVLTNVGVTKGSLYHHFGSVNDLFIAGILHAFEEALSESKAWSHSMLEECHSAKEARDRLRWIIEQSQVRERQDVRSLRLHALSLARTQPSLATEIARIQAELTDVMTDVIREMQQRGWSRADIDPRANAVLIQAMNLGRIVDDVVAESDRVDPDAWIALFKDVLDSTFIINE
jgi:AcrR family transcriptional regulator